MSGLDQALIISRDLALQNVVEQVCRVSGYRPVSTKSLADAETILAQREKPPFMLVMLDIRVIDGSEEELLTQLPDVLQLWATPPLTIPCLYLGFLSHKYAALATRTAPVPFLTLPVSASELRAAMQELVGSDGRLSPP